MQFADFALPESVISSLAARGITTPTPIQEETLPHTLEGKDVLGRARTGTGKTLAFGLPIITRLEPSRERGRTPRALVLAPTRELAKQVAKEFEQSGAHLSTLTIYGGTSYTPQERELHRGVDIVVGTPGRVTDHLERGTLDLSGVEVVVLDEADEMLSMGFQEAVEKILETTPKDRQTMLFSATVPKWVERLARGYLRNPIKVDLVGDAAGAQAHTTKHIAIKVNPAARTRVLADCLTVMSMERAIVFTRTKRDCDELALELIHRGLEAEAIHGDLHQAQRERALEAFRSGRARVLVATDVAARGLDIPEVDLVVQHHFPNDPEAYVHRSGRTGRAGRSGTAVVLHTDRENRDLRNLEHATGVYFERREPPARSEVQSASASNAAKDVRSVPEDVIAPFRKEAEALAAEYGTDALAMALAWIAGVHEPAKPASLITGEEGMTTLLLRAQRLSVPRAVAVLAQATKLNSKALGKIKPFREGQYQAGVAADVPTASVAALLELGEIEGVRVERAEVLPELIEMAPRDSRGFDRGPQQGSNRFRQGGFDRGGRGGYQSGYSQGGYSRGPQDNRRDGGPRDGAPRDFGARDQGPRGFDRPREDREPVGAGGRDGFRRRR